MLDDAVMVGLQFCSLPFWEYESMAGSAQACWIQGTHISPCYTRDYSVSPSPNCPAAWALQPEPNNVQSSLS